MHQDLAPEIDKSRDMNYSEISTADTFEEWQIFTVPGDAGGGEKNVGFLCD